MNKELFTKPHRRFNPLTGEWVIVSPHRLQRPWQGQVEKTAVEQKPTYDPACYLCPGNERAGGNHTPAYDSVYVFNNDYPGLLPDTIESKLDEKGIIVAATERGIARVLCFTPRHDLTLPLMEQAQIEMVVEAWAQQYQELGSIDYVKYVSIFENRGAMMGASNPHPHGQIWAQESLPNEPRRELANQLDYFKRQGSCMLCDYVAIELREQERIVCENDTWMAVVPFWATWPYEIMLLSKHHNASLTDLHAEERAGLAEVLKRFLTRYDNLFETSFPYSMGFHQAPTDGENYPHQHLHAHFYPPLLRSATVRKFMVGYEMLGGPQRDITAELAAEQLRNLSEEHYSLK
jgi:UDPglucose--hexose-1-phosphate uridylyltransferase